MYTRLAVDTAVLHNQQNIGFVVLTQLVAHWVSSTGDRLWLSINMGLDICNSKVALGNSCQRFSASFRMSDPGPLYLFAQTHNGVW